MGEIAEMMTDGTLCRTCGVYVGVCGGYPVACEDCKADEAEKPKRQSKQVTKRGPTIRRKKS